MKRIAAVFAVAFILVSAVALAITPGAAIRGTMQGARTQLRLEREQAVRNEPGAATTPPADTVRLWSDASGKHRVSARFVRVERIVVIEAEDGREIRIPSEKLSEHDRQWLMRSKAL